MNGKPCEKLQVVHLRCSRCYRYHYNTRNQGTIVVVHHVYCNDPMQAPRVFQMSNIGGRSPLGFPTTIAEFNSLRRPTNQYYSQGAHYNSMTTSIPSSMPSLEDISL